MSTLSSANVTDVNLVLKECTHMRLCINMLIFTHNLGNWLMLGGGARAGWLGVLSLISLILSIFSCFPLFCFSLGFFSHEVAFLDLTFTRFSVIIFFLILFPGLF